MTDFVGSAAAWYVVQCKPRQNFRAEDNLKNQGYTCFHPIVGVERIRNGKRCVVDEPLFPGYLFIYLDTHVDNWSPIRSTRGVSRVVTFNGRPVPVEPALIDGIRGRLVEPMREGACLRAGDALRMVSGPFSGFDAVFQSFDGDERVVILLQLLQRTQSVVVPVGCVEKA